MVALTVRAIGLLGPGLSGWTASLPVLRGDVAYHAAEMPPPKPMMLPEGERRRVTTVGRLALSVAEEALATAGTDGTNLTSVFASSSGDMEIFDRICRALLEADRPVSPTQFHNSVHNAPAGYWAIASCCSRPSVSLSGFDGSFGSGLLEAATLLACDGAAVLLVAYDAASPPPLAGKRPIPVAFAVALVCAPSTDDGLARLAIEPAAVDHQSQLADPTLEQLRRSNPAARSLPLLQAIARGEATTVVLPGSGPKPIRVAVSR